MWPSSHMQVEEWLQVNNNKSARILGGIESSDLEHLISFSNQPTPALKSGQKGISFISKCGSFVVLFDGPDSSPFICAVLPSLLWEERRNGSSATKNSVCRWIHCRANCEAVKTCFSLACRHWNVTGHLRYFHRLQDKDLISTAGIPMSEY